jgi:UDP-2-acetamido-2,6-beta-L-arabino-hexul-4-ose reductase
VTRAALTGGDGFLGWHTWGALRAQARAGADIPVGARFDPVQAGQALSGAERFIHLAGVNRGSDDEVYAGNLLFADQVVSALRRVERPPAVIVYANSIQSALDNPYGRAKAAAADILAEAAAEVGAEFHNICFPNLFGEHGRPFYNSVVATFCHLLAQSGRPEVDQDRQLTLLHAQDAADLLTGAVALGEMAALSHQETVSGLLRRLTDLAAVYRRGEIPDLASRLDRDLFNTYRSFAPTLATGIALSAHADQRGAFVEILRCHGGGGQTSVSTTQPGVTRGQHFHRRKVERFVVLAGQGRIALRRLGHPDRLVFDVDGDQPVAVDMPTLWAHHITNTGSGPLYTAFWSNELFDPDHPDTYPEPV